MANAADPRYPSGPRRNMMKGIPPVERRAADEEEQHGAHMNDISDTALDWQDGLIGQSLARPDARGPLNGRGRYVDDLALARLVHVAFVRSPHAHARIAGLETAAAEALPGVVGVLTGAELAERTTPWLGTMDNAPALKSVPQYGLAVDIARWQGEAVVAVAAETRAVAEDAAELVRVDWEELPAVAEIETALDPQTPVLHPSLGGNQLYERTIENGDAAAAFAAADKVVEGTFLFGRHTGVPLEARAMIADFDPAQGRLTLHYSGQATHMIQVLAARHLGMEERDVRVVAHDVGGSYGIKSHFYGDEFATAVLSMKLARPVKFMADRLESFVSDIHARDHKVTARMAVSDTGEITALEVDDLVAAGAYSAYPRTSSVEANQVLNISGGPYDIENYHGHTRVVFQNKTPISQYRGVGHPIAILVGESLMDMAADATGLDPVEIRRKNFVPDDSYPRAATSGVRLNDLSHQACLEKLVGLMDYDELRADQAARRGEGVYRGIGLAAFIKGTNPGPLIYGPAGVPISGQEGCTVRFEPSGSFTCLLGVGEQGQGTHTIIAQIVASALGVDFQAVKVISGDTDSMPYGGGTYGSRGAGTGGEVALRAALGLRQEILDVAATLLQADAGGLDIRAGDIVERAGGATRMSLGELGKIAFFRSAELPEGTYPDFIASRRFRVRDYIFTNGVHGCYAEVDPETGFVRVLDYWAVEDVGRIINPQLVEEQVRGAIIQGFGDALYEHCIYDAAGQLQNGTLADYLVPMAGEMPDITLAHVETPTSETTLGAKGAGESGTAAAPGTIFNAVNDALKPLGARVTGIPITPRDVLTALAGA